MTGKGKFLRKTETKSKHSVLSEGRFALGVVVGLVLCLASYLSIHFLEIEVTKNEFLNAAPAFLALAVALVSLLISYNALFEQRRIRQAGTDPVILVHLGKRSDAPMMITFEVSNVGAGAALNVTLSFDKNDDDFDESRVTTNLRNLTHPIRVIKQNQSVQYNFGVGHRLLGDEPIRPFHISVKYQDIEENWYSSTQIIDVRELHHQMAHSPPMAVIAKSLERLSKDLTRATEGGQLRVLAKSTAQHEKEMEEMLSRIHEKKEGDA
ncbi:hypothetical protein [Maritimibacter sp. 55A14]|uniref:hypothetical protein n=1 Tax=Maritimibacter sp. 55A14 TaxID=2174844 RepID=UPI0011B1C8FF|nr:hypothetical protein [Maritimibacter sp. 55A14]